METLLAKSPRDGRLKSLVEHTTDVLEAVDLMFGPPGNPTRLAARWLNFFQVNDPARFAVCLRAATAFHDWGKANDGFQAAVRQRGEQAIRHEHLSALMLALRDVDRWTASRSDVDWDVVLSAVVSHHLNVSHESLAASPKWEIVKLPTAHRDFLDLLALIAKQLQLAGPLPNLPAYWHFKPKRADDFNLRDHAKEVKLRLRSFDQALASDEGRRRLLWAVRAALIAADAAGSGIPRIEGDLEAFLAGAFDPVQLLDEHYIFTHVVEPRVAELQQAGCWRDWNQFQRECDDLPQRALLLAPCGSGKTLAAWRWIARQCRGVRRVIFLYPTRATALEGFRDYVSWAPEADAALVSGTADFDLQDLFANPDDPNDPRREKRFETEARLFALRFWSRRVFSATVDQFLAFMQYAYGPMCLLPLLVDSVVVVDEAHSFDRGMYSVLKDFLRQFRVPVLCMTATMPTPRRDELVNECGLKLYDGKPGELRVIADAQRYRVQRIEASDAPSRVCDALASGRRVLWVVNQVGRAQTLARAMALDLDANPWYVLPGVRLYCYHSRFRLKDRRDRHGEVVAAFRRNAPAALAIATQVCEMSLDMDADLLVSELAPMTALIQRMGRCNRVPEPRPTAGDVLVYEPDNPQPYQKDELEPVREFLREFAGGRSVSQADLEQALECYGPKTPDIPKDSRFVESGPYALAGEESFRDSQEFTVPAVLDEDLPAFRELHAGRKPADGLIVPVPRRLARWGEPGLPSYVAVAPASHYHPYLGFCDEPVRNSTHTPAD